MNWLNNCAMVNAGASDMPQMMPHQDVSKLFTLAHDGSEDGRAALVTALIQLFDRDDVAMSAHEQTLLNDIVGDLIAEADLAVRQKLAEELAPSQLLPRRLALSLASDRIEVARPILSRSPVLTDSDLVSLIHSLGTQYARAVAEREIINEAVVEALVVTGDIEIMQTVAENLGAKISPKAMAALVNAARFADTISQGLFARPDLPTEAAAQLYWWVAPALRRVALQRFGVAVTPSNTSLEQTVADLLKRYSLEKNNDTVMTHAADWLFERDLTDHKCLTQILRAGHYRLFSMMLSRMVELPLDLIHIIITEMGGRSLSVICRTLQMDKSQFVSIFLLSRGARGGEQVVQPRELNNALIAFDRVNPEIALQLIDSWRVDPSYLLKHSETASQQLH
jgi:uncharacterized protein (DUF2336 family)